MGLGRARLPNVSNEEFKRAIEAIKLRAPIEDVVRERVPALKKSGALWVACCPFHDERTPSFKVDPRRGTWHCFGACGTGGDQISFLERFDNLGFLDAVEILAARTGVELPRRQAPGPVDGSSNESLAVLEHATRFYRAQLRGAEGRSAARYLSERGLSEATGEAFAIGYAPASGQALVQEARAQGLALDACVRAGLVRKADDGRPYDFFRGRLMIPIRDPKGATVGFGARRLVDGDEAGPKYVNTPETELFRKGRLVYALDRALPAVRKSGRIVLVEGYTDVMAAHQCAIANVVAVLGTATTEEHAGLIRKTGARRVSLVFDGDEAGRKAAYKALHGLLPLEVELDVVWLPGGDDPCDLIVRDGGSAFLAQLELAQGWFDFLVAGLRSKRGAELSREVDRVLELLARLSKPVHRDARIAELAAALAMPVATLRAQYAELPGQRRGAPAGTTRDPHAAPVVAASSRDAQGSKAFELMLGAVLVDASTFSLVRPHLARCTDDELARVFAVVARLYEDVDAAIDESSVLSNLFDDEARRRVVPCVQLVRSIGEDDTPKSLVESQIEFLDRREREAERLRNVRALAEREGELLRAAGERAAASDPTLIEVARRMSTPTRAEDPIHHG